MMKKWNLIWLKGRIHHTETTQDRVARHGDQTFEENRQKTTEDREIDDNGDEPLAEKKKHRGMQHRDLSLLASSLFLSPTFCFL